jgi:hypothetical protein
LEAFGLYGSKFLMISHTDSTFVLLDINKLILHIRCYRGAKIWNNIHYDIVYNSKTENNGDIWVDSLDK